MEKFFSEYYPQNRPNINPKKTGNTEDLNYSPEGQLSIIQDNKTEITDLRNRIDNLNKEIENLELNEIIEIQTDDNIGTAEKEEKISKIEKMVDSKRNVIKELQNKIIELGKNNNFIIENN